MRLRCGPSAWQQWLAAQGLEAGDRFVVFLENRIEFLELGLAARKVGLYILLKNYRIFNFAILYRVPAQSTTARYLH